MIDKKLKYIELLSKIIDCPTNDYYEISKNAFRWVHESICENDFLPVNIISDPPQRILDYNDKMCIGYGLSLFDTLENASLKYQKLYKNKREHIRELFKMDIGTSIAMLELNENDGIANEPIEQNFGHFTFHEYGNADLPVKIKDFFNIFTSDGEFTDYTRKKN